MKTLLYANSEDRARDVLKWVHAFCQHLPMEAAIQTGTGRGGPAEAEAARLFQRELAGSGKVSLTEVREGGGTPEEAIAARTLEGDFHLVILAPAGRRGFIRLFYGSMVAHVVRRVSTSVLVVRPLSTVPPRRILVGVSGSRHSLTNVTVASQLAGFFGAELTLLTVLSQLTLDSKEAQPFESGPEAFLASDHPLAAQLRVGSEISQKMGAPAKVRVRQGLIGDQALEEIREFGHDLLVVGTHRADDFDTVYEDITDELVRMSPVSTLVVGLRAGLL